ncbi:hypothetical protein KJ975_03400 [Myxococcota bacterium]|nr:hypothetical protein [Myxococcota bacterium]
MKKLALSAFLVLTSCAQMMGAVGADTNPSGSGSGHEKTATTGGGGSGGTTPEPTKTGGDTPEPVAAKPDPTPPPPTGGKDAEGDDIVVVAPRIGLEVIKPFAAPWCDLAKDKGYSVGAMARAIQRGLKEGWGGSVMLEAGEAVCVTPGAPGYMKNTMAIVQDWVNMTGQTKAEAVESIRARMQKEAWEAGYAATCNSMTVSGEASDEDKALNEARRRFFGCNYHKVPQWSENNTDSIRGYLDFGAGPVDPVLQVYEVRQCLFNYSADRNPQYTDVFNWAVCSPVGNRLDKAAFDKHVAGLKLDLYGRTIARESFAVAKMLHLRYAGTAKGMIQQEPAFKALFEIPEKEWTKWEKLRVDHKAAIDAAMAYHKLFFGPSKNARKGCFENLRKVWAPYIAKIKVTDLQAARTALTHEVNSILTIEMMLCSAADGQSLFANLISRELGYSRFVSGPRTGTYWAMIDAIVEIIADRESFPMRPKQSLGHVGVNFNTALSYARDNDSFGGDAESVIDKLQPTGDDVKIIFIKTKMMVDELSCKQTNKISRINDSGIVEYQSDCRPVGKKEVTLQEEPVIIPAWAAGGLKKGNLGSFFIKGPDRRGFPATVWADKDKKSIVNYLGVELK